MLKNGLQLQAARSLAGLTQAELAARCGLNHNAISNLEKKRDDTLATSTVEKLTRIENALNECGVRLTDNEDGIGATRRFV